MNTSKKCVRCGGKLPPDYEARRPCPRCLLEFGLGKSDAGKVVHPGAGEESPSAPTPREIAVEIAEHFPGLEILEVLGEGGMGVVYRARQLELGREVALKILRPRFATEPSFAERFSREARALARLSHPGIVAVHDFGRAGDHFYLLMELVEGTNLRRLIRDGDLTSRQALEVVSQVCSALQFAHDQGVVHRDIKPENILIDRQGTAKIADFGLAKIARGEDAEPEASRLTKPLQAMGTPQYMAPEQIEHPLEVDHRADIYSLGVVFYELLTGELPLGRFAPPSDKVEVDVRLDEVVLRSLEKEPERRYQHASEVRTGIEEIQQQPEPEKRPMVTSASAERRGKSTGFWVLMVLLSILALGCIPLACGAIALLFLAPVTLVEGELPTPIEVERRLVVPPEVAPEVIEETDPLGREYEEEAKRFLENTAEEFDSTGETTEEAEDQSRGRDSTRGS
jgi:serine/threonine protein kinase